MRKFILSLACAYGLGLSLYSAWWYPRDMHQLEVSVQAGNPAAELRHRLNTWGNVNTLLLSNLIFIVSFAALTKPRYW